MFALRKDNHRGVEPPLHRLKALVQEVRDRPTAQAIAEAAFAGDELDVMALLVELRGAAKRGIDAAAARRLGPEFTRYLSEFYSLPAELQPPALEALVHSGRREQDGDLDGAVRTCETALHVCPDYLPLIERLARLESARGQTTVAERWYTQLLVVVNRLGFHARGFEICRQLMESGISDPELLAQCAQTLETGGDLPLAANCWSRLSARLVSEERLDEALSQLDHALHLQPDSPHLNLELAMLYERMGEVDRASAAFEQAAALAGHDADTYARVLLIRGQASCPDEAALGHLMDLLESRPLARANALQRCAEAVAKSPYNPHFRYIQGVLLAQDGQIEKGIGALRIAIDRYAVQSDHESELEARLALQQIAPHDEDNHRRVAELHFGRGEVQQAMKALAALARATRNGSTH